ncbi:hypothetical protein BH10BAC3_BH10BAC3_21750 [soil metagenome]
MFNGFDLIDTFGAMLQRITAILILTILLLSIASRYPAFKFEQWQIREAISRRIESLLPQKELHLVSIAKNSRDIEWIRRGKEFRYRGQLYDVVRSEAVADTINYYCINDDDETQLVKLYDSFALSQYNDTSSPVKNVSISVLKIFFSLIYIPKQEVAVLLPGASQHYNYCYRCFYSSASISIAAPPPKRLV